MTVCEFLHCSFSELPSRCSSLADQLLVLNYVEQKALREKNAMDNAKGPPPENQSPKRF